MHRSLPLAIGTSMLVLLAASPPAKAASFQCDASALRVTVATAPAVEPISANHGAPACTAQEAGGALPATPLAVSGGALFARTTFTGGADPLSQVAGASAGLGALSVALPLPALPALDLSALPGGGVLAVPGIGSVDLRPALAALIAPSGPLLALQGVTAEARASCQAGSASVTGASRLGELSVLGTKLSTTDAVDRNLGLDSQSIDPSDIDISKVLAPAGDLTLLQATLQPILDTLPNVEVPAIALRVRTTPGAQVVAGDKLTRRALQIQIELGGTSLLDAVVGEATVDATGVSCGSLAAAALGLGPKSACTTRRLTLIDVVQRGSKVKLQGAADPRRFAGKNVRIISRWNGKTVSSLKVAKSGLFTATLKLPPSAVRHTNRARYQAVIGKERSLSLKLDRRMIVTTVRTAATRKVTLSGRVSRPLGTPVQEISVTRRISCGNVRVVARFKPDSSGRFKVTLKAPRTDRVYTFRFRTKVRYSTAYPRLFRTYTLPQYVVGS
jgi:hypothetical protein